MKKTVIPLVGAFLLMTSTLFAGVGELTWAGKNTWTYNKEITGDKPGDQWDTQLTDQQANPVKWVLHKAEANPVIWLRIDDTVASTDPKKVEADLKARFQGRGINVDAVQEKDIGGKKVLIVSGQDQAKDARYSTAVFPKSGTKRAYQIELTSAAKDFSTYEPAFMGMVQTVRVLP
jgi:hypothetical protein